MKTKIFKSVVTFLIFVLAFSICPPYKRLSAAEEESQEQEKEKKSWLVETGFITGFNRGKLKRNKKLQSLVFSVSFGFDLMPLLNKININLPGRLQMHFAPFLNPIIAPEKNVEFGSDLFMFKYSFPLFKKFWPFFEAGNGFIYSTQHTPEQSTQWNFITQGGIGFSYFIKEDLSIDTS